MKKFLCTILTLCILLSSIVAVDAKSISISDDESLLECVVDLGILPYYDDSNYVPDRQFFVGDYLNGILNILGDYAYIGTGMTPEAKKSAETYGLFKEGLLDPYKSITLEKALDISLQVLGYKDVVSQRSSEYQSACKKLKSGINIGEKAVLTQSQGMRLLYNTAFAPPMRQLFTKNDGIARYSVDNDEGLIYTTRGIYAVSGVLNRTSITSLDSESGLSTGKIAIEDEIFNCKKFSCTKYLGYDVYAFVKEQDSQTNEILHIEKSKNVNEITITEEDIVDIDSSCRHLTYWKNESSKRTDNLAPALKCIYNGKYLGTYSRPDFLITDGSITLIDNDQDKIYEVAKINHEKQLIIDTISSSTETVFGRYTYAGSLNTLKLDESEVIVVIEKDGKQINFKDLSVNDVLSVIESPGTSDKYIHIDVSSKCIKGELTEIGNENELYVDGYEYKESYSFTQAETLADPMFQSLNVGKIYKVYLDYKDRVVYAEKTTEDDELMGLLYKFTYKDHDDNVEIKIYDTNGMWNKYRTAEKIRINGIKQTSTEVIDALTEWVNKIVKIKLNSVGEIKSIETPTLSETHNARVFTCTPQLSEFYYTGDRSFAHKYFVGNSTPIIAKCYTAGTSDEDDYTLMTYANFTNIVSYNVTMYDLDEFNYPKAIYVEQSNTNSDLIVNLANLFVVSKVGVMLDEFGDVCDFITGTYGKNNNVTLKGSPTSLSSIKKGDVLSIYADSNNNIRAFEKRYGIEDGEVTSIPSNLNVDFAVVKGKIDKIDANLMTLRLSNGSGGFEFYRWLNNNNVNVYIYDSESGGKVASVADIEKGDYVVIRYNRNTLKEIVVFR